MNVLYTACTFSDDCSADPSSAGGQVQTTAAFQLLCGLLLDPLSEDLLWWIISLSK